MVLSQYCSVIPPFLESFLPLVSHLANLNTLGHPHPPTLMLSVLDGILIVTYLLAAHLQETLCFPFTVDS